MNKTRKTSDSSITKYTNASPFKWARIGITAKAIGNVITVQMANGFKVDNTRFQNHYGSFHSHSTNKNPANSRAKIFFGHVGSLIGYTTIFTTPFLRDLTVTTNTRPTNHRVTRHYRRNTTIWAKHFDKRFFKNG